MVDRNTTLQNKDNIKDSNSTSTVKFIILELSRIYATIDNSIQIYNYWTLNDFTITIYFYIIVDNSIFSFLFLYVLYLKFKNNNLSYKLILYIL